MRKTWIHDINASPEGKREGKTGVDLGGGCRGCPPGGGGGPPGPPPPPPPEMTCGFLTQLVFCKKKRTLWFIGVEVEQETSAPAPKKEFLTRVVDVIADIFYSPQQLVPRQYKLILE